MDVIIRICETMKCDHLLDDISATLLALSRSIPSVIYLKRRCDRLRAGLQKLQRSDSLDSFMPADSLDFTRRKRLSSYQLSPDQLVPLNPDDYLITTPQPQQQQQQPPPPQQLPQPAQPPSPLSHIPQSLRTDAPYAKRISSPSSGFYSLPHTPPPPQQASPYPHSAPNPVAALATVTRPTTPTTTTTTTQRGTQQNSHPREGDRITSTKRPFKPTTTTTTTSTTPPFSSNFSPTILSQLQHLQLQIEQQRGTSGQPLPPTRQNPPSVPLQNINYSAKDRVDYALPQQQTDPQQQPARPLSRRNTLFFFSCFFALFYFFVFFFFLSLFSVPLPLSLSLSLSLAFFFFFPFSFTEKLNFFFFKSYGQVRYS